MMVFEFVESARKSLEKMNHVIRERILIKLLHWQKLKNPLILAKKLTGHKEVFRYRVGDWRIIVTPNYKNKILKIIRNQQHFCCCC